MSDNNNGSHPAGYSIHLAWSHCQAPAHPVGPRQVFLAPILGQEPLLCAHVCSLLLALIFCSNY